MTTIAHSGFMAWRHLRNLMRQPAWILISLVQPMLYLLIFAPAFRSVVEIPGFASASYVDFLTPGIVVMTVLFSGAYTGMSVIEDLDRGVVDRFLVSPASRASIIAGRLLQGAALAVMQAAIIFSLGAVVGAEYPGGLAGMAVLLLCAVLLGEGVGALSCAGALLTRREETLLAGVNMLIMPLTFLSAVFMQLSLMPGWIQAVARYNPVNWAVTAGREAMEGGADWGFVWLRVGVLAAFALVCAALATSAFRAYRRSV